MPNLCMGSLLEPGSGLAVPDTVQRPHFRNNFQAKVDQMHDSRMQARRMRLPDRMTGHGGDALRSSGFKGA
jgi:hypothetical protein